MATTQTMDDIECVNLDGLDDEDLSEHEAVYFLLAGYCSQIRQARFARKTGSIQKALALEEEAQRKYEGLPANLRW